MNEIQLKYWREFHARNQHPLWRLDVCYHGITNIDLKHSTNGIYEIIPNKWHEEGTVYTHTAMVYDHAMRMGMDGDNEELLFSALAHDIGKPFLRDHVIDGRENKIHFIGHDFCSALMSVNWAKQHFDTATILKILKAIALHTTMYKVDDISNYIDDKKLYSLLSKLAHADVHGRYSIDDSKRSPIFNKVDPVELSPDKPWLTVLIGIPGSGKSTVASKYGKVFSSDDYMEKYARTELGVTGNYSECFSACMNSGINWKELAIIDMIKHVKDTKENVVFDATNGVRKKRMGLVNRLKKTCNIRYVLMWRDLLDCRDSRSHSEKYISDAIYKQLLKAFSYPSMDEGYNSIEHILV